MSSTAIRQKQITAGNACTHGSSPIATPKEYHFELRRSEQGWKDSFLKALYSIIMLLKGIGHWYFCYWSVLYDVYIFWIAQSLWITLAQWFSMQKIWSPMSDYSEGKAGCLNKYPGMLISISLLSDKLLWIFTHSFLDSLMVQCIVYESGICVLLS